MRDYLDLDRYPIDRPDSGEYRDLVVACQRDMELNGMFNLHGLVRPAAIERACGEVARLSAQTFTHQRRHNVYFENHIEGLPQDHGALRRFETVHHTLCADQLQGSVVLDIYEFPALAVFLAAVLRKARLFLMSDALARVNVMEYRAGETLNWHFDRSLFTVTLLLQAAAAGGEFEYRAGLRTESDPNYDGVACLLSGSDRDVRVNPLAAGTLNVFAGKNTLHRVSEVCGARSRLVAVYSYYEQPGVLFSEAERVGFFGRAA